MPVELIFTDDELLEMVEVRFKEADGRLIVMVKV
jgi:hypothetical protein